MVIRNDPVTVKHTKLIFTDVGKVMMAFILATDFDFIAYMSKMAWVVVVVVVVCFCLFVFCFVFFFFGGGGKLFSCQWRFWNMISIIFVVLYDILH